MKLSEILTRPARLIGMSALTDDFVLDRAAQRIRQRWPDVVPNPPERDREKIVRQLLARLIHNDWKHARLSLVCAAARAAFDEERRNRRDLARVHEFLTDECAISTKKGFLGCMVAVYLESYEPGASHTIRIAAALDHSRPHCPLRWRHLLTALPELLDPVNGPARVAMRMVDAPLPYELLRKDGMTSPHGSGFMDYAHLEFISSLAPRFSSADSAAARQMFSWLSPSEAEARERGAEHAVSALLKPWLRNDPPDAYKNLLLQNLVSIYGDPRVRRSGVWGAVPEESVILRWLVGATLEAFLDIVSEAENSHMWAPRREFWLSLYRRGRIDQAWVALSEWGAFVARRHAEQAKDNALRNFGKQTAGGSRTNTSLLILKIGSKIVVEGSHNYKVHIFRDTDPEAPELYRSHYNCETIRLSLAEASKRSHIGNWQGWVLERV